MEHGNIQGNSMAMMGSIGLGKQLGNPFGNELNSSSAKVQSMAQAAAQAAMANCKERPMSEADSEANRVTYAQERLAELINTLEMRLSFVMRPAIPSPECGDSVQSANSDPESVLGNALRRYSIKTEAASERLQSIIGRLAI